jgi:hypothetical protein
MKEMIMAIFKALSWTFPEETEEKHKIILVRMAVFEPKSPEYKAGVLTTLLRRSALKA